MSHTVFQTTQIIPISPIKPTRQTAASRGPLPPPPWLALRLRRPCLFIRASSPAPPPVDSDAAAALERCFSASPDAPASTSSSSLSPTMFAPVMKKEYGAFGAVTLEKPKLDVSRPQADSTPQLSHAGGGGDIGKIMNFGGGDGGDDDGGDDDDYDNFDDDDEGDEGGLFRKRMFLKELFDRKFVDAVLNEWKKTMMDLPAGLRQQYEMHLVSSAQMVRFLAINARPTAERFISRALPPEISRAFIGRMLADTGFWQKLCWEGAATLGCSVWWELKSRKGRLKQEWDQALINVLTVSACNAFVFWSLAPCRSYGNTFRFDLQNTMQKLPNNIFEMSYPLREFNLQKRFLSFFFKAGELCMVGMAAGAAQNALLKLAASKEERLSVTIPSMRTNSLGYGAFLGIYANLRYQLLCGLDRAMFNHFDVIGVALFLSMALRTLNVKLGDSSRLAWLGVEVDPLVQSDNPLMAYNRPSESVSKPSSKWFISRNAIVSSLGLLGMKQQSGDSIADGDILPPKQRRKRTVRKRVTTV